MLRRLREESGLRQQDVAARMGKHRSFVSRYESGARRLDVVELRNVCQVIGVPLVRVVDALEQIVTDADRDDCLDSAADAVPPPP